MQPNSESQFVRASIGRRFVAYLIDHFTFTFLMAVTAFLALGPNYLDQDNPGGMIAVMLFVMLPGMFVYLAKDAVGGVSPGRWVMNIAVRDMRDPAIVPSFGRLLLRNLLLVLWPIEFIVLVSSSDQTRLGDRLAKTRVVKKAVKVAMLPRVLTAVVLGVFLLVSMIGFIATSMKQSDAYKTAVQAIEQHEKIVKGIGGIKEYGMIPSGSVTITNGHGSAHFGIPVIGQERDVTVFVTLEKDPGELWIVTKILY